MLTVYHSNDLDLLKSICAHIMAQRRHVSIFAKDVFLVQNTGMETWLKIKLAQDLGILANIDFLLPAQFLKLSANFGGQQSLNDGFQSDNMMWKIAEILAELVNQHTLNPDDSTQFAPYTPVFDYLARQSDNNRAHVQLALAKKIAILFDQYLILRPEMLLAWEANLPPKQMNTPLETDENAAWQADLWRRLIAKTQALAQSTEHLARIYQNVMRASIPHLQQVQAKQAFLPSRLFVIGISSLPPMILNLLEKLGHIIDIHLFFTNPSPHYWGDISKDGGLNQEIRHFMSKYTKAAKWVAGKLAINEITPTLQQLELPLWQSDPDKWHMQTGHPLLASLGQLGRDNLLHLNNLEAACIDAFVEPDAAGLKSDTLLHRIQREIYLLRAPENAPLFTLKPDDDSIILHHGVSPNREIETLYDILLSYLDKDPDLNLNDIVVMAPNIDLYEPFIHAIFGNAPPERALKYSVTDQHISKVDPLYQAVLMLLSLNELEFKAEHIATLLHIPEIITHFEIDNEDVPILLNWIEATGIRFGRDGEHIHSLGLPIDETNSFAWGIKRMLLGYASISDAHIFSGYVPFTATTGMSANLAGKFALLIEELSEWCRTLDEVTTLSDLTGLLLTLETQFFTLESLQGEQNPAIIKFMQLHTTWQNFITNGLESHYTQPISMGIMTRLFAAVLDRDMPAHDFLMGKINFCTLMPMRAIPFKVVCILGLNQDQFPKVNVPDHFDLIASYPKKGDRNKNSDDRYLFLEALLAARNHLYLSFIGRSATDNQVLPPSILVDELLDYIDKIRQVTSLNLPKTREAISIYSPLFPFDDKLFSPEHLQDQNKGYLLHSYQSKWIDEHTDDATAQSMASAQNTPVQHIKLIDLIRFYNNPLAFFCKNTLALSFYETPPFPILPSTESFGGLKPLENYTFNEMFVADMSTLPDAAEKTATAIETDPKRSHYRGLGILPKFKYEDFFWEEKNQEFKALISVLQQTEAPITNNYISLSYEQLTNTPCIPVTFEDPAVLTAHPDPNHLPDVNSSDLTYLSPRSISKSFGYSITLEGELPALTGERVIQWSTSKGYLKRLIKTYLYHLARAAAGQSTETIFYSMEAKKSGRQLITRTFPKLTAEYAKNQLAEYIEAYLYGSCHPLLWLSELHHYISDKNQLSEKKCMDNIQAFLKAIATDEAAHHRLLTCKPWMPEAFTTATYAELASLNSITDGLDTFIRPIFNDRDPRKNPELVRLFNPITDIDLLQFISCYIHLIQPIYEHCAPVG